MWERSSQKKSEREVKHHVTHPKISAQGFREETNLLQLKRTKVRPPDGATFFEVAPPAPLRANQSFPYL